MGGDGGRVAWSATNSRRPPQGGHHKLLATEVIQPSSINRPRVSGLPTTRVSAYPEPLSHDDSGFKPAPCPGLAARGI